MDNERYLRDRKTERPLNVAKPIFNSQLVVARKGRNCSLMVSADLPISIQVKLPVSTYLRRLNLRNQTMYVTSDTESTAYKLPPALS